MIAFFGGSLALVAFYSLALAWGWRRVHSSAPPSDDEPPVSVVVAARNEAENLPNLLEALDCQTHSDHEVVLVDDASTDETGSLATAWAEEHPSATVLRLTEPEAPRKKNALTRGVEAASHGLLAFTDADCTPPPDWLSVLARTHAAHDEDLVLVGYSPLQGTGILGWFARYETLVAGAYAAAAAGLGRPYMAVGRNLSYPRRVFEAVDGFSHAEASMSGDDDLFVQTVRERTAATIRPLLDARTFVPSPAAPTWRAWLRQKRRHLSAGRFYSWSVGLHLTLFHASLVALWGAPAMLGTTGVGFLATGLLLRHTLLGPAADTFQEHDLLALFPIGELGYALYHLLLVPFGLGRPPEKW